MVSNWMYLRKPIHFILSGPPTSMHTFDHFSYKRMQIIFRKWGGGRRPLNFFENSSNLVAPSFPRCIAMNENLKHTLSNSLMDVINIMSLIVRVSVAQDCSNPSQGRNDLNTEDRSFQAMVSEGGLC